MTQTRFAHALEKGFSVMAEEGERWRALSPLNTCSVWVKDRKYLPIRVLYIASKVSVGVDVIKDRSWAR